MNQNYFWSLVNQFSFAKVIILLTILTSSTAIASEGEEEIFACTGIVINSFPYEESFDNTTGSWDQNTVDDQINWSFDTNATPTNGTGPNAPLDGSHYLYYESSNPVSTGDLAIITSPCIDLTLETSAFFSFDYHMYGSGMGTLDVEVSADAGSTWTNIFTRNGEQQAGGNEAWLKEIIDLSTYTGNTINLRFKGTKGATFRSDMAIDNVRIDTYCISESIRGFTTGITRVNLNTIDNNTTTATTGYSDFTAQTTNLDAGSSYNLNVNISTAGNNTFSTIASIDWNQDFDFNDPGETYDLGISTNEANSPTPNSPLSIIVPVDATIGTTRMRISHRFDDGTAVTACDADTNFFGEVEDYTINVLSSVPQPEIAIYGLGNTIFDGDITPNVSDDTDYGTLTVGGSLNHTFTVTNSGTATLTLSGAILSGSGSSQFTLFSPPAGVVAPGDFTTFIIAYNPTTGGVHNATFTVTNNDNNENPYNFNIIGNASGPQPEIALDGMGNQITDGSVTPIVSNGTDFGAAIVTTSISNTFNINNIGSANLNLTGASPYVVLSGSPYFSVTAIPSSTIIPGGGTTTFEITYNPLIVGTHTATVSIANDDSDENPFDFVITGEAVTTASPEIDIEGNATSIANGDTTPSLTDNTDFDNTFLGQSTSRDFTINNTGTSDLVLTGSPLVQFSGGGAAAYSVTSFPISPIPAGGSTTFQITYTPGVVGTDTATVSIESNDSDENPFTYTISGTASINTNPLYTIYNENFDATNGGWVITNPGGQTIWTYGQNAGEPTGDGNYFYTSIYNDYADDSDTYVTSPVIDLTGYTDLRLQIDVRHNLDNDVDDAMNIEYSSDGGSSWNILGTDTEPAANNWYNETDADGLGNDFDGWAGINDSTFDAAKSQFSVSYIDLPAVLQNNPTTRFRVRFASDNDGTTDDGANFDNIIITGNPLTAFGDPTNGPASVNANLRLWLKADSGITSSDGTAAATWADQARDNDALVTNQNAPIYHDNATENINHNPVLAFNEADKTQLKGKGGFFSQDYWVVLRQNGTIDGTTANNYEGIVSGRISDRQLSEDASGFWTGKISIRFSGNNNMMSHMVGSTPASITSPNASYGKAYSSTTDSYTDEVIIVNVKANSTNTSSEIYKNGIRIDNIDGFAFDQSTGTIGGQLPYVDLVNSSYALGVSYAGLNRTDIETWFNGKITEVISFSASNSLFDQKRIQSYLALKNGVTLHSINSVTNTREGDENYIDSDGAIYWDTTVNNGYNYDIAGIGKDDASGLNQKQSTSSNPDVVLTMGLTDIYNTNQVNISSNSNAITDKNFLVWGNDNASYAAAAPIQVDMSASVAGLTTLVDFTAIQRTWKVVERGSIGTVKVSVPEVSLSATITPPGNFLMFVSDTPSFSPTSEYRIMTQVGINLETTYDFVGTKYITFGYAPEYIYERSITFDGVQDYMDADDVADLTGPFTISAWVKLGANAGNKELISKKNEAPWTEGYSLRLTAGLVPQMTWKDASGTSRSFDASVALPQDEWHHVAVIYDGALATFFIDGVEDTTFTAPAPATSNQHFMIAAADYQNPTNFFDGTIDEARVWNKALSQGQLQYIMNQEVEKFTDGSVLGKIVPQNISKNEVAAIPWTDLEIYLPMNRYTFTNVKDESDNGHVAAIKNLETVDFQTAPLPYVSTVNGLWNNSNTWINGATQELPGAPSLIDVSKTIDWNIVQTSHDVRTVANNTVLSLEVLTSELSIENDSKIEVSHYLRLDGVMDLVGESQLIQTEDSDLEPTSIGRLERDQQGTADTYSYNIWSSPVGQINPTAINQDFTMASIMNDGTNINSPASINFSSSFDGAPTTPITLSAYWLFSYRNNPANTYSAWEQVGPYGVIAAGDGYTMKGPGTGGVPDPQNYTFIGKPNNSTTAVSIDKTITAGNEYLVGNPFPSALDADKFIMDNPHLTGTLSFWEHWGGGNHFLADYQAGYALYTLSGGTPAVSHPAVDQTGSGTKTPTQFIAVGQGFFVKAVNSGTTTFSNSQRTFAKEDTSSSFFFSPETTSADDTSNIEDDIVLREDMRQKIRIGFDSPSLYHRQLLMTIDDNTTFGFDRAYDAIIEYHPQEDMTWMMEDEMAIIQGVPGIENDRQFPLRITLPMDGEVSIGVDALENVNTNTTTVFVYDRLLESHTDITNGEDKLTLDLTEGTYADRFFIIFETKETEEENDQTTDDENENTDEQESQDVEVVETGTELENSIESDNFSVFFDDATKNIIIDKRMDYDIKSVQLFTILGQLIKKWTPETETTHIELRAQDVSTGAYILNIQKMQTTYTKKLIIH